jgi:hypothetical protein
MLLVFIFLKQQQIVLPATPLCLLSLATQTAKTTVLIDDFKLPFFVKNHVANRVFQPFSTLTSLKHVGRSYYG